MINKQKEEQVEIRSEDTEQIRDEGGFNEGKKEIRNQDKSITDQQLEKKWEVARKPLKLKYPDLNDDDLHYDHGEFGEMLGRIGSKTGLSESQLRHKILNWDDSPFETF